MDSIGGFGIVFSLGSVYDGWERNLALSIIIYTLKKLFCLQVACIEDSRKKFVSNIKKLRQNGISFCK